MIQAEKMKHKPYGPYEKYFKRPLDFLCGLAAVFVFWWMYLIIAILVRIKLGSPVLFTQDRPGKDEKIFKLYKFRTMTDARDENGELLPDEVRLTKFGRMLRATSLDELPEAFNIIKGDLSMVGPRPLLVKYLPFYTDEERDRHSVRPGLTGLAQINGRNNLGWSERFKLDCDYVHHISLKADIKILLGTVIKVIKKSDITEDGNYMMMNLDEERRQG
jgi:lipopolysaccharide/colanic/teichoic acid biosynthesis glycosyltransferase